MVRNRILLFALLFVASQHLNSQVGISSAPIVPHASSILEIQSSSKGILIPRMNMAQRNLIASPANALMIYQTDNNPGYYYNYGSSASPVWRALVSANIPSVQYGYKIPIDTLPFIINTPGSYIVTEELSSASTGIIINTSGVSIDLNFFSVIGLSGNTSNGILVNGSYQDINIYNGTINNWVGDGIAGGTGSNCRIINVTASNNGGDGIFVGNHSLINKCISHNNILDGIDGGISNVITESIAFQNGDVGIESDGNSTLSLNTSYLNTAHGIKTSNNCQITQNSCSNNISHGFFTGNGNAVTNNTANENTLSGFYMGNGSIATENVSRLNGRHGFECNQDVTCIRNSADSNIKNGFDASFNGGKMDDNNSTDNENGFNITGTGWILTRNSASGNVITAFTIVAGNLAATIVTSANLNTNTNPYANISY